MFDPFTDPPVLIQQGLADSTFTFRSWEDRKTALRQPYFDVAGTWSGEEVTENGEILGSISVKILPNWSVQIDENPLGPVDFSDFVVSLPKCGLTFLALPTLEKTRYRFEFTFSRLDKGLLY